MKNITIEKESLLLVEGKDEVGFFEALLKHMALINTIQIIDIGGKDTLKKTLPTLLLTPNFSRVKKYGIIRDADDNKKNAFESVIGILRQNKQPAPEKSNTFVWAENLGVGVYIMPGDSAEGMLEDLCLKTVEGSPVLYCVDQYISCLRKKLDIEEFPDNESKAKMHTFLAGKYKFVPSLGIAAQNLIFILIPLL